MTPQPKQTNDLTVVISKGVKKIRFTVTSRQPPLIGQGFDRPELNLVQKEIEELETGNPTEVTVAKVVSEISRWFAREDNDDFRTKVKEALAYPGPVRFIFSLEDDLAKDFRTVPFELCHFENTPLAFKPNVRSIVHLLPYAPNSPSGTVQSYPFRVLIIRANPKQLGGAVPPAAELRNLILKIGDELGKGAVEVDLLSREEEGVIGLPTLEKFHQCILGKKYHVMLFLGHGAIRDEISILQFEQEGNDNPRPVWPANLQITLSKNPVPVVLLAGCLTSAAAQPDPSDPEWLRDWLRGNQGMAQALLSTETGVQLAVGMRYRLEAKHARLMIQSFFQSLLVTNKGNVEEAVKSAREALIEKPGAAAWSAPAIYRNRDRRDATMSEEPLFGFLLKAPTDEWEPVDLIFLDMRQATWRHISQQPALLRTPAMLQFPRDQLRSHEVVLIENAGKRGSVLLIPQGDRLESQPASLVDFPLQWSGSPGVQVLRLEVVFDGPAVSEVSLKAAPGLKDLGYSLREVKEDDNVYWQIFSRSGATGQALPEGIIGTLRFKPGAQTGVVYAVRLVAKSEPSLRICSIPNAVIVPLP